MKVGITGHQNMGNENTILWIRTSLLDIISNGNIELGYTCLAVGADQLFAEVLLKKQIPYHAVIPCRDYESTFRNENDKKLFKHLLEKAYEVKVLSKNEANEEAFYEAGKTVVDLSDYVIAIWNGKKAKGLGGTGDIVKYALNKGKKVIHINNVDKTVSIL